MTNERLSLARLINVSHYGNYAVESVTLVVRNAARSSVQLLVDGVVEDSINAPTQTVTLYPAYLTDLDDPSLPMELMVSGKTYISSINVRIRTANYIGEESQIRIPIVEDQDLNDYEVINLLSYVNVQAYRGYRVIGVEMTANAYYANATLQLLADNFMEGQVRLSEDQQMVTIFPSRGLLIGQNFSKLALITFGSGVLNLAEVTLRLGKY